MGRDVRVRKQEERGREKGEEGNSPIELSRDGPEG